ncbi:MAG: glycosyltransferase [Bacteroidota bacterium]|nr:glycosyltransferase [Bacteroidota bacterium]
MEIYSNERLRVLFLPRWYPNRYDSMQGLFVRQQAEALTAFCNVAVLYIHPDPMATNDIEVEVSEENSVHTVRIYIRIPSFKVHFLKDFFYFFRIIKAYKLGFRILRTFQPDLIHVQVLTRQGVVALVRKWLTGVPYVITEHWSRYLPESNSYHGTFRKCITKIVVRESLGIIAVSGKLKDAMIHCGLNHQNFKVIPNLVDTDHFVIRKRPENVSLKRILHVSCFDDSSKNISGFLRVIKSLSQTRNDFECLLVGEGPDLQSMKDYAGKMGLDENRVRFTGLMKDDDLVNILNSGDLFVLSSHYETFGTVIIESLSCGLPVVATNTGIAPEVINERNGRLVSVGNEEELGKAIAEMLDHSGEEDRQKIRQEIIFRFDRQNVSREIFQTYLQCLKR